MTSILLQKNIVLSMITVLQSHPTRDHNIIGLLAERYGECEQIDTN